ncbi:MAG: hypothetical protein K6T75_00475 [Acetobacteraceae bacterium]|nr:hypothetical protein [Acetobacteraceae bacterium]
MAEEGLQAELLRLLRLQGLDSQRDALAARLAELESSPIPAQLRGEVDQAVAELEASRQEIATLKRQARWHEREADAAREERRAVEQRLYGGEVRSLKEMEQMEKKIQALKDRAGQLEEQALLAMERLDELEKGLGALEARVAEARRRLEEEEAELARQAAACRTELEEASSRREALAVQVDPAHLELYEYLRSKKAGLAVVELKGGACGACRVALPVILANRVKRAEDLCRCENCGRLLCWVG